MQQGYPFCRFEVMNAIDVEEGVTWSGEDHPFGVQGGHQTVQADIRPPIE